MPKKTEKPKEERVSYYEAVGRRKVASARVRLYVVAETPVMVNGVSVERGAMVVNSRPIEKYFPGEIAKKLYLEPFRTTNTVGRFAVTITTRGGGHEGQLEASVHGISRALEKVDR